MGLALIESTFLPSQVSPGLGPAHCQLVFNIVVLLVTFDLVKLQFGILLKSVKNISISHLKGKENFSNLPTNCKSLAKII